MADTEEKKPTEEKKGFNYPTDHRKSMRVIAKEIVDEQRKERREEIEKETESTEKVSKESEKPVEKTPPAEKKEEIQHTEKETPEKPAYDTEEVIDKAAVKAAQKLQDDLKKLEEDKSLSDKQKEEEKEKLKTTWQKEGRTPKDYDEVVSESTRIAKEQFWQEYEEREAKKASDEAAKSKAQQENQAAREKAESDYRESVEKMTLAEVEELETEGVLQKPVNTEDPNDPAVKERRAIFEMGLKVNTERMAKGLQPIISISRIYYNYYKPSLAAAGGKPKQPAGGDAPIAGAKTTANESSTQKPYIYARDHGKSMRQIISEVVGRGRK